MERENFFILLDISIDPPESDLKVINAAISSKQAEWSRLRNHPTKGLTAQKYINMLPEIRRVMLDLPLRAVEAEMAVVNRAEDREGKVGEIDRHIDILMGKGFVAKDEIVKLAEVHGFSAAEVQDRINLRQDDKYAKVDQQIGLRMAKGYVTPDEIEKIAKRHSLKAEEVRKRVRCPIRKEKPADDEQGFALHELDRSIEKAIRENLKVVGKKSLYDFLGLPESSDLKDLQTGSARKKKELSGMGRKDAQVTSGNILAGQCMMIFKSDETRNSYDVSLAKSRLAELDSDIDIAGMSGKVRPEYFLILVEKAVEFGMDGDEAETYIKNYCRQKGWGVELPPEKKRLYLIIAGAATVICLLLVILSITFYSLNKRHEREAEYKDLVSTVEAQKSILIKKGLLADYVRTHSDNNDFKEYVADVSRRISELEKQLAENVFNAAMTEVSDHITAGRYEEALNAALDYQKRSSNKAFSAKMEKKAGEIKVLIEKRDYESLSPVLLSGAADEKIAALTGYLEKHPKGKHVKEVRAAIASLTGEFYIFIDNRLKTLESEKNWEECARLCNAYIHLYDNAHSDQLKARLAGYSEHIRQNTIFDALVEKAGRFGTDYGGAVKMYEDYSSAYPDSILADRIRVEVDKLKVLQQKGIVDQSADRMRAMLAKTGGRFVEQAPGVVEDTRTGLMWTLLDSDVEKSDTCLTYDLAEAYVKGLSIGGFTDWRLPSPAELVGIYQKEPVFPAEKEKWYWSSKNYTSYSDGWHKIVEVIYSVGSVPRERRESVECGVVRAVRGK
ncbi:MAG: DUF1566 domain-containing protein [Deltaproteobacteria bacterium]|nr:DUF1566 domain-containing protein [Deltaproteobacteria bacterium]